MKLVVQVKLLPTPEQASALEATLRACNQAATYASSVAFAKNLKDRNGLQKEVYADLKATFGLSAQPAVRLVKKVVDAYKAQKAGVPFLEVDAAYTSQRCPRCGNTDRANRPDRDRFCCRRCGLAGPADVVAGVNVRDRARSAWVFVTAPAPSP
ncbi:zinc ribbon domain-containing protein [Streptomyces sp. 15-116A]|uniref:zinc ribbon domain-containing protein n=1 Tax=Streptomyces sp. 15-116A TaxID=2259035 RepID=UPI0021B48A0F|nr:zinc ribbon domain-containing protein [Streptomyces sp. 15-116A]MCT7355467.1 zinc ribbon domain-containing protein [Streptomyces sp. 15-116A]